MEKLQKLRFGKPTFKGEEPGADNPIIRDNRAFDIVEGDKKTLDYLDYSGMLTKSNLAACGKIKLYPYGSGAMANPIGIKEPCKIADKDDKEEDFENEWDNIFLKKENSPDIEDNENSSENFFTYQTST